MVDVSKKTNVTFKMLGRYLDVEESDLNAIEEENVGYHSTQERKYQAGHKDHCLVYLLAFFLLDVLTSFSLSLFPFLSTPNRRAGSAKMGEHAR